MNMYFFLLILLCQKIDINARPYQTQSTVLEFIETEQQLTPYYNKKNVVMIASTGRSGSNFLTLAIREQAKYYDVLKSHLLPPTKKYAGKIIFISSNPDKAAESALHITMTDPAFGARHFYNMKSADKNWLTSIGSTDKQTINHNLLAYDALGCYQQLVAWLHSTIPAKKKKAQILAIKYENLWDSATIAAIKEFLRLDHFELPPKRERGSAKEELNPQEIIFRETYNKGTEKKPIYPAYDDAREIWKTAPAVQYLNLPNKV